MNETTKCLQCSPDGKTCVKCQVGYTPSGKTCVPVSRPERRPSCPELLGCHTPRLPIWPTATAQPMRACTHMYMLAPGCLHVNCMSQARSTPFSQPTHSPAHVHSHLPFLPALALNPNALLLQITCSTTPPSKCIKCSADGKKCLQCQAGYIPDGGMGCILVGAFCRAGWWRRP